MKKVDPPKLAILGGGLSSLLAKKPSKWLKMHFYGYKGEKIFIIQPLRGAKSEDRRPPLKWPILGGLLSSLFLKNASELRYLHVKVEPKMPSLCPGVDQKKLFL